MSLKWRSVGFCLLLAAAPIGAVGASEAITAIPLLRQTVRDELVLHRSSYNYAPAVIHDGPVYHLYWCGGVAGDFILHLRSSTLAGPWRSSSFWSRVDVALSPTTKPGDFDSLHTCDPNVLKVGATYFLYYTGQSAEGALGAVGVAASDDGVHFKRLNGGGPIVSAAKTNPAYAAAGLTYGAGQPAVAFVAPYVYLSFTDSTGAGGDGQFALRSRDPAFAKDIEELTATGWQPRKPGQHTAEYSYLDSYGLDLTYDGPSGLLIAASDRDAGHTTLSALDPKTLKTLATGDLAINWREGPAIVSEADKTTAPRAQCDRIAIDVFAAEGPSDSPFSWNALGYSAGEFSLANLCRRP